MITRECWPYSKVQVEHDDSSALDVDAYRAALRAVGLVPLGDTAPRTGRRGVRTVVQASNARPELFGVGARVLVSLANGYESWGTVRKVFANGARLVHEEGANGPKGNRGAHALWADPDNRLSRVDSKSSKSQSMMWLRVNDAREHGLRNANAGWIGTLGDKTYFIWKQGRVRGEGAWYAAARVGADGRCEQYTGCGADERPAWLRGSSCPWLCNNATLAEAKALCVEDAAHRV